MNPNPNWVKEAGLVFMSKSNPKTRNKFGKKKTVKPHPQTLTLTPKSDEIRSQEPKKPKGEEEEGGGLPHRCAALLSRRRAGKRKGRPGALLAGIRPQGRRSQAARRQRAHPLGSAHAGEGADDDAGALCSLSPLLPVARCCCAEERERSVSGEERERAEWQMS